MLRFQFLTIVVLALGGAGFAQPPKKPLTEAAFNKAIAEPLTARFDDTEIGRLLKMLGDERRLAFLIDRRIDPTRHVSWRTEGEPLLEAIDDRLSADHASARSVGSTIFVGPEESLKKLRTVIALRKQELDQGGKAALKQQFQALRGYSLQWDEAATPREVLATVASRWNIRINGIDEAPYDLWPAGSLTAVNFIEALSVLLMQYERTFEWNKSFNEVTIIPMPEKVWVERRHAVPVNRRETILDDVDGILKSIDHTLERDRLMVRGSIEEHEKIATLLGQRPGKSTPTKVSAAPLKQRLFTLTAEKVRIADAFQALREQGVTIQYDEEAFAKAGVDFEQRVDLKMNKASADLFLTTLCEPLGVAYEIDGLTVRLTLRK